MQNKKKVYLIISIVSFSIVLAALAAIGGLLLAYKRQSDNYEQLAAAARTDTPAAPTTPATEAVEETQPVETATPRTFRATTSTPISPPASTPTTSAMM